MMDLFNQYMDAFKVFVNTYFNKIFIFDGITIGWFLVAIAVLGITIHYLAGRLRS